MEPKVYITRAPAEIGKTGRVYVTGPHFKGDIYSSTTDMAQASKYDLSTARELVRTKWRGTNPQIEEIE